VKDLEFIGSSQEDIRNFPALAPWRFEYTRKVNGESSARQRYKEVENREKAKQKAR
jgi:phage-related protein